MEINEAIGKKTQRLNRLERNLALLKLKERKAQTRRKIELGGLVVKAKMDGYSKAVVLGALIDAAQQLEREVGSQLLFQSKGEAAFMGYGGHDVELTNTIN